MTRPPIWSHREDGLRYRQGVKPSLKLKTCQLTLVEISFRDGYSISFESRLFIIPCIMGRKSCVSQPVSCVKICTTLSLNTAKIKTTPTLSLGHRDNIIATLLQRHASRSMLTAEPDEEQDEILWLKKMLQQHCHKYKPTRDIKSVVW